MTDSALGSTSLSSGRTRPTRAGWWRGFGQASPAWHTSPNCACPPHDQSRCDGSLAGLAREPSLTGIPTVQVAIDTSANSVSFNSQERCRTFGRYSLLPPSSSKRAVASAVSEPGHADCRHDNSPRRPAPIAPSAFAGFCFPPDVILLAVRWYLRFALSYRDVEELLTERGIQVDHVTVYRWVLRFTPLLAEARPALPPRGRGPLVGR
jgi:hypothetical protein